MIIQGTNFIPLEGTINTRDLGGYTRMDGRKIKNKRLLRSDCLHSITKKDALFLTKERKRVADIDFRSPQEAAAKPEVVIPLVSYLSFPVEEGLTKLLPREYPHPTYHIPDSGIAGIISYCYRLDKNGDVSKAREGPYRHFISGPLGRKGYKDFLHVLYQNKEGSILFHCADGKDRCGVATRLLLSLLGRKKEDIIKDYLLTNVFTEKKAKRQEDYLRNVCHIDNEILINSVKILAGVRENFLLAAYDEIDKSFGGRDSYLHHQREFTDERIQERRNNYLE